jgi:glycosyltransferase involved in cell wall biosynthesis
VLVNSNAVRDKALPITGKKPVHIIPNGIETGNGYLKNREAKLWLASEFGFNPEVPVVVMVSNCNRDIKRVDLLIEAAPHVLKEKKANFLIVGDGHLRPGLERRAKELGVGENVVFAGSRNDVPEILAGSDVFVNASDSEGFSNSVMEAMRAGVPVVASDVAGNKDIISSNETGLFFKAGSARELSQQLLVLLKMPNVRRYLVNNGKKHIDKHYSIDVMNNNYKQLYLGTVTN